MAKVNTQLRKLLDSGCLELEDGKNTTKSYSFHTFGGLKIRTKEAVAHAINLKIAIWKKDKITGEVQVFNFKTMQFEAGKTVLRIGRLT
jgi:hypothetical protein